MERFTSLSHRIRSKVANRRLGAVLAFVAGAINAGGYMAVHRYTSHMSGIVSSIADDLVLGNIVLALSGVISLVSFILGAATTAVLINWARRKNLHSSCRAIGMKNKRHLGNVTEREGIYHYAFNNFGKGRI